MGIKSQRIGSKAKAALDPDDTCYCGFYLPRAPIPAGRYLVHNHVRPVSGTIGNRTGILGFNGFRAWTQNNDKNLVECDCDFGGCKNAELHKKHYRVWHPTD